MGTPHDAHPTELDGLLLFIGAQRSSILHKLDGLTDEQASTRSTVSDLCLLTLVKHVAAVERRWVQAGIPAIDVPGVWPPPEGGRELELSVQAGDTIASVRAFYEKVVDDNRPILDALRGTDLGSDNAAGLSPRWILLHLVEELARHAGHADLLREAIDGVVEDG